MIGALTKYMGNKYVLLLLRLLLGFIFVYAGVGKIVHLADFANSIDNYRILPPVTVNIVAVILPWVEFLCGTFLILGIFIRGSSLLLSAMLFIFIVALSVSLIRGLDIECGCFLPWAESSKVGLRKLIEDIVMLAMGLQVFFFARPFVSLERLLKKS